RDRSTRLPPSRLTLFPYTTLFRSCGGVATPVFVDILAIASGDAQRLEELRGLEAGGVDDHVQLVQVAFTVDDARFGHLAHARGRSEEHTSELQSRFDLVCRLPLEK